MSEKNWGEKYWWAICLMVIGAIIWTLFWYWLYGKYLKTNNQKKAKITKVIAWIPWVWVWLIILVFDPFSVFLLFGGDYKKNEKNNENQDMKNLKYKSWIKRFFWDKK